MCYFFSSNELDICRAGGQGFLMMKRREFITVLGGAAAAWPLTAQAQQSKVRLIGILLLGNADAESFRAELRDGLRKLGYIEGQNIDFEFRSADGKFDLLPKLAAELVALRVDVILALYTPCALAAQQATREIPVVVVSGDPVVTGLVASLNRPGGNITGISLMAAELHGKCVELFRDMLPSVRRVAVLLNAEDPFWKQVQQEVQLAGRAAGIEIAPSVKVRGPNEIDAAFAAMKKGEAGAVVVHGSLSTKNVAELALKHGLPADTKADNRCGREGAKAVLGCRHSIIIPTRNLLALRADHSRDRLTCRARPNEAHTTRAVTPRNPTTTMLGLYRYERGR
jgi:putative tryptophan/tyrosine transport system substrate-binding protein